MRPVADIGCGTGDGARSPAIGSVRRRRPAAARAARRAVPSRRRRAPLPATARTGVLPRRGRLTRSPSVHPPPPGRRSCRARREPPAATGRRAPRPRTGRARFDRPGDSYRPAGKAARARDSTGSASGRDDRTTRGGDRVAAWRGRSCGTLARSRRAATSNPTNSRHARGDEQPLARVRARGQRAESGSGESPCRSSTPAARRGRGSRPAGTCRRASP